MNTTLQVVLFIGVVSIGIVVFVGVFANSRSKRDKNNL